MQSLAHPKSSIRELPKIIIGIFNGVARTGCSPKPGTRYRWGPRFKRAQLNRKPLFSPLRAAVAFLGGENTQLLSTVSLYPKRVCSLATVKRHETAWHRHTENAHITHSGSSTLVGLQYRFRGKLHIIRLVCPDNGTAVLKGLLRQKRRFEGGQSGLTHTFLVFTLFGTSCRGEKLRLEK